MRPPSQLTPAQRFFGKNDAGGIAVLRGVRGDQRFCQRTARQQLRPSESGQVGPQRRHAAPRQLIARKKAARTRLLRRKRQPRTEAWFLEARWPAGRVVLRSCRLFVSASCTRRRSSRSSTSRSARDGCSMLEYRLAVPRLCSIVSSNAEIRVAMVDAPQPFAGVLLPKAFSFQFSTIGFDRYHVCEAGNNQIFVAMQPKIEAASQQITFRARDPRIRRYQCRPWLSTIGDRAETRQGR